MFVTPTTLQRSYHIQPGHMTGQRVHLHCSVTAAVVGGLPDAAMQARLGPAVHALSTELPAEQQQLGPMTHGTQADKIARL